MLQICQILKMEGGGSTTASIFPKRDCIDLHPPNSLKVKRHSQHCNRSSKQMCHTACSTRLTISVEITFDIFEKCRSHSHLISVGSDSHTLNNGPGITHLPRKSTCGCWLTAVQPCPQTLLPVHNIDSAAQTCIESENPNERSHPRPSTTMHFKSIFAKQNREVCRTKFLQTVLALILK